MSNLISNKFARPIQFQRARISKLRFPRNERRTRSRLNESLAREGKPNNFLEIEISRRSDKSCCTWDRFACFSRFIRWRGARPCFASLSIKRTERSRSRSFMSCKLRTSTWSGYRLPGFTRYLLPEERKPEREREKYRLHHLLPTYQTFREP